MYQLEFFAMCGPYYSAICNPRWLPTKEGWLSNNGYYVCMLRYEYIYSWTLLLDGILSWNDGRWKLHGIWWHPCCMCIGDNWLVEGYKQSEGVLNSPMSSNRTRRTRSTQSWYEDNHTTPTEILQAPVIRLPHPYLPSHFHRTESQRTQQPNPRKIRHSFAVNQKTTGEKK